MERIDNTLKSLIYKNISFVVDGKPIKEGNVRVFNTKQNFIKFKIDHNGNVREWELPYPYRIFHMNGDMVFDYCLSAFCPRTEDSYWKMLMMDKSKSSKLHNNYLFVIDKK